MDLKDIRFDKVNKCHCDTWEDFLDHYKQLKELKENQKKETDSFVDKPLFRGQANAEWILQTTLERYTKKKLTVDEYFRKIYLVNNYIATCTGKKWDLSDLAEEHWSLFEKPRTLEFITYLRQNGFPSPFLDWTYSPYIAIFFAIKHCLRESYEEFAVFAYFGMFGAAKMSTSEAPYIQTLGNAIASDRKHYLQQCAYSFCLDSSKRVIGNKWKSTFFANHEDSFSKNTRQQDVLFKFILPGCEAPKILEILDEMNINEYSLFESEPALMSTLAQRHLADLRAD
ncbi:MAG: FRG domain-containing protein [Candidatus Auribacterota bacterium]